MVYQTLIAEILQKAQQQEEIQGVMLTGSVARGDALPGTDLDLRFLLAPDHSREFQVEHRQGIMIERGYADVTKAQQKLATNPMEVYAYLDGRILFDPTGTLARLAEQAREQFNNYTLPEEERHDIIHWLGSIQLKLRVATSAGDLLRAAYVCGTASWPILTALWAANNRPMPPNGSVWVHLKDLTQGPEDVEKQLRHLFTADKPQQIQTALDLVEWCIEKLRS